MSRAGNKKTPVWPIRRRSMLRAMRLPPFAFAVLDTETTGFLPKVHHIAEWACVRCEGGKEVATYESLIAIPDTIPPHVQVLTRIKPEMLTGKPTITQASAEFLETLGQDTILVGQNLGYDLGMLKGEGIDLTDRPWIDTSLLAALVFPELRSYSLQYLSTALKLPHEPQHRALGDVRATTALLGAIWERLCALPIEKIAQAKETMERSSDGYRMLFAALPLEGGKGEWLENARARTPRAGSTPITPPASQPGTVTLFEETLDPSFVPSLIAGAAADKIPTCVAVKNLDSALKRHELPDGVTVLHPPALLLNTDAAEQLKQQESLSPEEATLALKVEWFSPRVRADLSLHAGERDVWNGKLAATADHPAYVEQCATDGCVRLLDHRQLFDALRDPENADRIIPQGSRIIIDDASMLEDTATKAFGSWVALDDLRAAAQGHELLTQLADRSALWAETLRTNTDLKMLGPQDFSRRETQGLRELLQEVLEAEDLPARARYILTELHTFLTPSTEIPMLSWIETRAQSGSVSLHSAPERVDLLLKRILFQPFATILLVPPALQGASPAVLPEGFPRTLITADSSALKTFPISLPDDTLETLLRDPPEGKTIALVGSKRLIEMAFINHTERLEEQGVTLICQGMAGGQGRMESEFLASEGTTVWLLTPFMYEGIDLSDAIADHLLIDSLPFDHPGQPVFGRRKDMFANGFEQYALVRLLHRAFRLLRAFSRHATPGADVRVLDQRMKEKSYGNRVRAYLETFSKEAVPAFVVKPVSGRPKPAATKKPATKKDPGPQQALPL